MQNSDACKLLIVDDESGIRESLKDFFELEGFKVADSDGGMSALEVLKKDQFDVVLSDIRMPEGDGRFLLKSIRELNPINPIVILMSGYSDVTAEEAYAEGAVAILTKPFNPVEVMEKVKAHLQDQQNKWKNVTSIKPPLKISINATTVAEAIKSNLISCGQSGIFIKINPSGYRIGTEVCVELSEPNTFGIGIIRWTRATESNQQATGLGVELKSVSEPFKNQFLEAIKNQQITAIIPRN